MKKVFLYAYDKVNLGDDLFVHTIARRYPEIEFYIWTEQYNKVTFKETSNINVLDKNSWYVRFMKKVWKSFGFWYKTSYEKRCDAVVYIGGSIFIEYENWREILSWWDYEAEQYPFYVLGANFGPYKSEEYRQSLKKIYDKMRDVCFRDIYSYGLFHECSTVRYAPDILFSCKLKNNKKLKKRIFISVINCAKKAEGKNNNLLECERTYVENIIGLTEKYIRCGYSVILASFCRAEGDEETVNNIFSVVRRNMGVSHLGKMFYDGTNLKKMLQLLGESEYIIASRFHAVVLGIAAERPIFPFVYSDKTVRILRDIGFPGNYTDIRLKKKINFELVDKNRRMQVTFSADKIGQEAEQHFQKLDQILKN